MKTTASTHLKNGQPRSLTFLGSLVGAISIMTILTVGWFAFDMAIEDHVREYRDNLSDEAELLARAAEILGGERNKDVLHDIEELWRSQTRRSPDEYMCILAHNCRLVWNTAHPERIGTYVGDAPVTTANDPTIKTINDLVRVDKPHVGNFISPAGGRQVVAFAPISERGWMLGIHRSRAAVMKEVKRHFRILEVGFLVVCLVLIPFSLVLLYVAVYRASGIGKRAEQERLESEKRFLAFMNHFPGAAFIKDRESRYLFLNPYLSDFLGADDSWIGKRTSEVIRSKDLAQMMIEGDRRTLSEGYQLTEEEISGRKNVPRIFEVHKFPIEQEDGSRVVGGLLIDITKRKKEEEKSKRLASIVESSDNAIFSTTPNGEINTWNRAAERLFGYPKEEALGRQVAMLVPPDKIEEAHEMGRKLRSGQSVDRFETIRRKKDGTLFQISMTLSPIKDLEGNITGVSCIYRDISKQKRLESQLRQAQKMEAIGTLAGGIAHDFNNILSAVIGLSELALMETPEGSSLKRHVTQVFQAGMRARKLVQQILAFSRQQEHDMIPLSIDPIIKEALKLLRSSLPSTIEIRWNIRSDLGVIEGDPTQIHQVLMNLCTNAEHAMRETGGILEVTLHRVDMDEKAVSMHQNLRPGPYLRLQVRDSGKGMDPETMSRIFDPYFTTKGLGEGTGLGLAVVQGIVKEHHGVISVESERDKGTVFQVYFPVIEMEKGEMRFQGENQEGPLPTGNERILFVDDEQVLVNLGSEILEGLGYQVTTRNSSVEALNLFKARSKDFDLVITDMSMPQMNGEQFSRELMALRPDIPIILCTGFSHIISEEKARKIGIRAFAMKPVIRTDLARTVRKVLDDN